MSPVAHRALFASCLTLGLVDLAWLDANAARVVSEASPVPPVRVALPANVDLPAPIGVAPPALAPPEPPATAPVPPAPAAAPRREELPPARGPVSCVILFDRSLSIIHEDQAALLAPIADAVNRDPSAVVRIFGHADRMAWKANRGNNQTLSEDRAAAVARVLDKLGVRADRIRRAAFGDTRPVDERSTEDAFQRNRRVEVRVERTGER